MYSPFQLTKVLIYKRLYRYPAYFEKKDTQEQKDIKRPQSSNDFMIQCRPISPHAIEERCMRRH